jgi:hypothetical protein
VSVQSIILEIDRAWSDRLRIERQFSADRWDSWEAHQNAYAYHETALRTIDHGHKRLAALRAEIDVMDAHVASLAKRAITTGEPVAVAVAYLVYGASIL